MAMIVTNLIYGKKQETGWGKSFLSSISGEQSLLPSSMIDILPPRNTSNMTTRCTAVFSREGRNNNMLVD